MIEKIQTTPEQPASNFTAEDRTNFLYVLYSAMGTPMRAGVVAGSVGKREANALQNEVRSMATSGFVTSFRTLELGSERLAQQIGKWFSELFGSMLPLAGIVGTADTASVTPPAANGEGSAPKRRGRPAGKRGRKRGRPSKTGATPAATEDTSTAPKRRGRPRKAGSDNEVSATKGRRGRPRKAAASAESVEAPKRRGRKPKAASESADNASAPKRRGRARKNKPADQGTSAPARKGRSRKAAAAKAPTSA